MANFIFTLEALEAKEGDCLLLHYGTKDEPRLIVIDGGPKDVYQNSLRPRLQTIREKRGGGVMEIRMLMVSHIDGDHITGVLDLTRELREAQESNDSVPYDILTLWHNSFDDLIAKFSAGLQQQALQLSPKKLGADAGAVAADVKQGRNLRFDANALSLNLNTGFEDLVVFEDKAASTLNMGQKLSFLVLGPRQAELDALEGKWAEDLKKILAKKPAKSKKKNKTSGASAAEFIEMAESEVSASELEALAAAFLDKSIPNLSSIVVLATFQGKSILLTGDARGDRILDSLRDCKLLPAKGGNFHVDILKMPHHGSDRNMRKEFLEMVTADHYVFSANGKNGNPDPPTFKMLFDARPKGGYTLWLTNDVAASAKFIQANKPKKVDVKIRKDPFRSLKIELGDPIGL